jgi:hypothetical protein
MVELCVRGIFMNIFKKSSLMAVVIIALSSAGITPAMAAPADDALRIAKFISSGLKGLGGTSAKFNAILLRDAVRGQVLGDLAGLSPIEQAQLIANALDSVAPDLGISRRIIAGAVSDAFELPAGTPFTIGGTDFTVLTDGAILGGEDEVPVSAG